MDYDYRVYGLALRANHRLPRLLSSPARARAPDVSFDLGDTNQSDKALELRFADERGELTFAISSGGRRVCCDLTGAADVATIDDVTALLVGPVLGCTLRLRGELSLHASVVGVGGRAIVLVGSSGSGKSTIAAALAEAGHSVLSDDLAAITREDAVWVVHPGYPRLRLEPASLLELGLASSTLPVVTSGLEKRYVSLASDDAAAAGSFGCTRLELDVIYLLDRRPSIESPTIEPVPGAERVTSLMANLSGQAFMRPERRRQEQELASIARLTAEVPVRRMIYPDSLARLRVARDRLLDDLTAVR